MKRLVALKPVLGGWLLVHAARSTSTFTFHSLSVFNCMHHTKAITSRHTGCPGRPDGRSVFTILKLTTNCGRTICDGPFTNLGATANSLCHLGHSS